MDILNTFSLEGKVALVTGAAYELVLPWLKPLHRQGQQ